MYGRLGVLKTPWGVGGGGGFSSRQQVLGKRKGLSGTIRDRDRILGRTG